MNLIFLDTETTGLDTDPYARLCQLAYKTGDTVFNEMFKPPVEIGLGAMAVHHITEAMIKDKPAFKDTEHFQTVKDLFSKKSSVFVAHNAKFDLEMLRREGVEVKSFICSQIVARNILKDEGVKIFKLQSLRYYFNLALPDAKAHDAEGDVAVLEAVFNKLLEVATEKAKKWALEKGKKPWTKTQMLERFIEMSMTPIQPTLTMPFGKHAGITLTELVNSDRRYCEWLVGNSTNPNDNVITTIRYLLNKA